MRSHIGTSALIGGEEERMTIQATFAEIIRECSRTCEKY